MDGRNTFCRLSQGCGGIPSDSRENRKGARRFQIAARPVQIRWNDFTTGDECRYLTVALASALSVPASGPTSMVASHVYSPFLAARTE